MRILLAMTLALAACSTQEEMPAVEPPTGVEVFTQPLDDGNAFSCNTCHALEEPAEDGMRRVGHALGDAAHRPSWKDGRLDSFRGAVNSCVTEWMRGEAWSAEDPRWLVLNEYLAAQSDPPAAAVDIQIVRPPGDLTGGDADAGRALFNTSCGLCHGNNAEGSALAPGLLGLSLPPDYIAGRVRFSGATDSPVYDGLTGGAMPFWGGDRLSDAELIDLVAFITEAEPDPDGNNGDLPNDATIPDCPSTHALVGTTMPLTTRFHRVEGIVTVVNDCAVRIDSFGFDGQGIDVRIYGGADLDFADGFNMSADLKNFPTGYDGDTVIGVLPDGKTLDDLGAISIWCVPVGVSFGDAVLGQ